MVTLVSVFSLPKIDCACTLDDNKDYENKENEYTQNNFGYFCRCKKDYDPNEGNMLQCGICLEWYHGNHLAPPVYHKVNLGNGRTGIGR